MKMDFIRIPLHRFVCLFLIVLGPELLIAQYTWTSIDLISSGAVRCFCVCPDSILFAGCDNDGLFTSRDQGRTWNHVSSFPSTGVFSIVGGNGATIFTGTASGIYRSDDQGESWSGPLPGTEDHIILSIFELPDGEFIAGLFKKGILKSADRGMLWKESFPDHTVKSFVSGSDGTIYCISDGIKILYANGNVDRWDEFQHQLPDNVPLMTLYADRNSLLAGTAEGAYSYVDSTVCWNKILNRRLITAITRTENQILFCGSEEEGLFYSSEEGMSWRHVTWYPFDNIMCLSPTKGRNVIIGTTDGRIAISSPPIKKTWRNSVFSLGLAFGVGPVTSLSVGLAVEIKPIHFLSLEAIPNANPGQGNFTFQARGKIYPFMQLNVFFGGGYYHAGSFGGGHGGAYPRTEYCDYSGHEIFIGYRFPSVLRFEFGYRVSDAPCRVVYGSSGGYSEDYTYMQEWFMTAIFNLFFI